MNKTEYSEKRKSFLQRQYSLERKGKPSDHDYDSPDLVNDRTSVHSKVLKWFRRAGANICSPNCNSLLIGMIIGSLVVGIALAATLALLLTSGSAYTAVFCEYIFIQSLRVQPPPCRQQQHQHPQHQHPQHQHPQHQHPQHQHPQHQHPQHQHPRHQHQQQRRQRQQQQRQQQQRTVRQSFHC
ncbi:unnamed protein product [Rotaria socialis]|uniref:Uncharacterized protein n=1 Tax=Rotaria socialis TaxID=392032 RepID=A0A820WN30_9BILA|nr:unnamed protein product [Rotaria socialis]